MKKKIILIIIAVIGLVVTSLGILLFYLKDETKNNLITPEYFEVTNNVNNSTKKYSFESKLIPLKFSYLKEWGEVSENFVAARSGTGQHYFLNFTNNQKLISGGLSKDFFEARGSSIVDFKGFENKSINDICDQYKADICEKIKDNIILMARVPTFSEVCPPNPDQYSPSVILALNLPDSSKIGGLIFENELISLENERCDNKETFDQKMDELLLIIKNGSSNDFNILKDLAKSIEFY